MNKKIIMKTVIYFIICLFWLPIIILISSSLINYDKLIMLYSKEIFDDNRNSINVGNMHMVELVIFPNNMSFSQYYKLFAEVEVWIRHYLKNIELVVPIIIGQSIIATITAYGFEIVCFRYKELIYKIYIFIAILPQQVLLIANKILFNFIDFNSADLCIIIPALFYTIGVVIFRTQIRKIPKEYIEATKIDGANELQTFWYCILPNIKYTIMVFTLVSLADYWNMVEAPIVYMNEMQEYPLSVFLSSAMMENSDILYSLSFLYSLPVLAVSIAIIILYKRTMRRKK